MISLRHAVIDTKVVYNVGSLLKSISYTVKWGKSGLVSVQSCHLLPFTFMNEVKMVCKAHEDKVL